MTLELQTCTVCNKEKVKLLEFTAKRTMCRECNGKRCKLYRKSLCPTESPKWNEFKFGRNK